MKFIKDTAVTFSTQIITVVLDIVVAIIIARALGPEGKGAYALMLLMGAGLKGEYPLYWSKFDSEWQRGNFG